MHTKYIVDCVYKQNIFLQQSLQLNQNKYEIFYITTLNKYALNKYYALILVKTLKIINYQTYFKIQILFSIIL